MEYQILSVDTDVSDDFYFLEQKVNLAIEEGWKPLGGLAFCNGCYAQAMIKEA